MGFFLGDLGNAPIDRPTATVKGKYRRNGASLFGVSLDWKRLGGIHPGEELRCIASLRAAAMGQGATHARRARFTREESTLFDWHVFCSLGSILSGAGTLRGVVIAGPTLIRQGRPDLTPRMCSARGSGFGSGLTSGLSGLH